jgi:hypothetical protein
MKHYPNIKYRIRDTVFIGLFIYLISWDKDITSICMFLYFAILGVIDGIIWLLEGDKEDEA